MQFVRRISTRQLLLLCAAVVALAGGGTALAIAAGSGGPKPAPKALATAVHDALTAPALEGVTARIKFTNRLVPSSSLEGAGPILSGATGRLWASPDGHLRLELQSTRGDAQVVVNRSSFWVYDATSRTVFRGELPRHADKANAGAEHPPTLGEVNDAIGRLAEHFDISGATPTDVAGRPAYTVKLAPKRDGGLVSGGALAWDADHGVPLRLALYAKGHGDPVLELEATDISYGPVAASDFAVSPPAGVKTVDLSPSKKGDRGAGEHGREKPAASLAAVEREAGFKVSAPATLAGMQRSEVRAVGHGALVTYGRGLGGIAVLEQRTTRDAHPAGEQTGPLAGLSLPGVKIGGASGQELDTALGTIIRFERDGVTYTVAGSVEPDVARAAANGL